jgi:hypothetical protein
VAIYEEELLAGSPSTLAPDLGLPGCRTVGNPRLLVNPPAVVSCYSSQAKTDGKSPGTLECVSVSELCTEWLRQSISCPVSFATINFSATKLVNI